jgi:molybdopterin molybdotransferase
MSHAKSQRRAWAAEWTKMIPVPKAIDIVKRETSSLGSETVRLSDSVGRILAEDILADTDMPPFDRSQMDGFAVIAEDTLKAPVGLRIVGESAAGHGWHRTLKRGQAVRIMTGAPVPRGSDAIQRLELATEAGDLVTINQPTEAGRYIVPRGSEIQRRGKLFGPGDAVDEKMVATLAAFGYSEIKVFVQPRVSILGTGSEIVMVEQKPGRDQIRNSNSVMLAAMCRQVGGVPRILRQTGDELEKLKSTISKATGLGEKKSSVRQSEILVLTGGVSVGKYDLTKLALRDLGAEIFFERVRLRPGKPTVFGKLNDTLIFGLPGNPVSAAVTFYLFVRPAILAVQGAKQMDLPSGFAALTGRAKGAKERDTYLPATLETDKSARLLATPLRWHGSSDFVGFAKADALIFVKRGQIIEAGEVAPIAYL